MSYQVSLRNGTVVKMNESDGNSLRERWETANRSFVVRLGNDSVMSTQIVAISKERTTEADWVSDVIASTKQIEAKDRCRGQYSIQNEINHIAKEVGGNVNDDNHLGRKWSELLNDKQWRARTRKKLLATGAKWCDYQINNCECEKEFLSDKARHE